LHSILAYSQAHRFETPNPDRMTPMQTQELAAVRPSPSPAPCRIHIAAPEQIPWDVAHPFDCLCGKPSCVGVVRGYRHLDEAARARLVPFLAKHLRLRTWREMGGSGPS
jgi:hypothetical protein